MIAVQNNESNDRNMHIYSEFFADLNVLFMSFKSMSMCVALILIRITEHETEGPGKSSSTF